MKYGSWIWAVAEETLWLGYASKGGMRGAPTPKRLICPVANPYWVIASDELRMDSLLLILVST